MQKCIKVKTMDGNITWVMVEQISAVAEIHNTARTEGYTKIYIPGFEIKTKVGCQELLEQIAEVVKSFAD